ncbi:UDP-4-amino-4,6-dideoxy-N-acetyl-beta-L-altrosamine transaminase [Ectothiorhodospira lacustris]|uniref:UDP-4-amino-4, 6-dideoxy-N-acetyl-beta-L-altrosamine transaminase n=1 Tax=Ectothiorhodospira lacustris TaxID=2899127 RepID=UPI001EE97D3A|nr:UDP-4-amino-4,6-dideoxy-N-acetyl-beta-L-altrosamine transaminase [Ectothiorhodospira lacustris]MCG5501467.1 UDP-4-amino-4,6-dideoxy-N-acetyl-beta-L-altrosamine transaminase [Ectothiorhodospira lacustris]
MIPYGCQHITEEDIQAVVDVLHSDWLTQGPMVPRFEQAVADYCGVAHGVAVNSATSALHIACLSLGLGKGDWLWTSPITFVASANCGLYCGAQVDFVDIDPLTYNMSSEALAKKLAIAERKGNLPKIVVPVHMCGQSCDMTAIHALSKHYGFKIIEDASHAIGGSYRQEPIGCSRYSDITVFSFHPVKIITTGEGGMAVTNNSKLAEHMKRLRSHGITRIPEQMTHIPDGPWYYQQIELGFNYRMTELQAALGKSQLERIEKIVYRRTELAMRYDEMLTNLPLTTPWKHPDCQSSHHLYILRIKPTSDVSRNRFFHHLYKNGIGVNVHYIPAHTQPWYRSMGFREGDFPEAEAYYREAISLPLFPTLTDQAQEEIIHLIKKVIQS